MNIKYANFRSESQRQEIEVLVEKWKRLIPSYIETLTVVNWDEGAEGKTLASMGVEPQYLRADLNIYNSFFANSETEKEGILVHELAHTLAGKIRTLVLDQIIEYVRTQNEDLSILMSKVYRDLEEEFVESLSIFLTEKDSGC